jgi:prepilin-type N-terminal cleavage/methylation domain-containing protein/prepilin-type processing-associated H-X9-DG protein
MREREPRAFTLIELLVVIAIIAILAAILFPVFARAREKARTSSCSSNIKQLTIGLLQYAQDYDERFPGYGSGAPGTMSSSPPNQGWSVVMQPYTKSIQLLQCPSDKFKHTVTTGRGDYTDYFISGSPTTGQGVVEQFSSVSLGEVTFPTNTILLGDGPSDTSQGEGDADSVLNLAGLQASLTVPKCYQRHQDGANYGFVDGHVKWLQITQISPSAPTSSTVSLLPY